MTTPNCAVSARKPIDAGFNHVKMKVGRDLEDDIRRLRIAREVIGPDRYLMIDANQVWEVDAGHRVGEQARLRQAVLHRGADQSRRCRRTPQNPRGDRRR
jgi:L-alanine-DL-glutamate epimerase-like enolase superfamily enzyme